MSTARGGAAARAPSSASTRRGPRPNLPALRQRLRTKSGWRLAEVAASYEQFLALANCLPPTPERPRGSLPDAARLIEVGRKICGRPIVLVAIDMPMARHPIIGYRPSDRRVSKVYSTRHAATHSPSSKRPGKMSDLLRKGFQAAGYPLWTNEELGAAPGTGLVEVYPHPALIEFLGASRNFVIARPRSSTEIRAEVISRGTPR